MMCTISKNTCVARQTARPALRARAPLRVVASEKGSRYGGKIPTKEEGMEAQQEVLKQRREHPENIELASGKGLPGIPGEKQTAAQTPPANPAAGEPEVSGGKPTPYKK